MRPIGFSTGAIAKGDFAKGLEIARSVAPDCVELSALRTHELRPLLDALPSLPLGKFKYVSIHAPKTSGYEEEWQAIKALMNRSEGCNIVAHPDLMVNFIKWRWLSDFLCIENMGIGKFGSSVAELRHVFQQLPEAGFCLDLGHARQVDPTMKLALRMLHMFGHRLRQIHISDVDKSGTHRRLSLEPIIDFRKVAPWIPKYTPIIIESTGLDDATNELYRDEVSRVRCALSL